MLTVTKVTDAGISSTGLPSQNEELPIAAKEVCSFLLGTPMQKMVYTKVIRRSELANWSVKQIFDITHAEFNPQYKTTKIGNLLTISKNVITIEPNITKVLSLHS